MSSSFAQPEPQPPVRRFHLPSRAPRPSAMWGAAVLCLGILIAAATTTDPIWWHLHFSRLGTFADASGYTFNTGVVISGLVIAAAGIPLAVNLATAMSEGRVADARAARLLPPLLVTLGLCLALIGVIPLTLNEFAHDRAANGVMLSFLGLVIVSRKTLPELPRLLPRYALTAVVVLVIGITLMFLGILNLAAFEVLAFGGVLSWVHLLERAVRRMGMTAPVALDAEPEESVRRSADAVRRGTRRRRPTNAVVGRVRVANGSRVSVHRAGRGAPTARLTLLTGPTGRGSTSDLRGAAVKEDRRADTSRTPRSARATMRVRSVMGVPAHGHRPPSIERV